MLIPQWRSGVFQTDLALVFLTVGDDVVERDCVSMPVPWSIVRVMKFRVIINPWGSIIIGKVFYPIFDMFQCLNVSTSFKCLATFLFTFRKAINFRSWYSSGFSEEDNSYIFRFNLDYFNQVVDESLNWFSGLEAQLSILATPTTSCFHNFSILFQENGINLSVEKSCIPITSTWSDTSPWILMSYHSNVLLNQTKAIYEQKHSFNEETFLFYWFQLQRISPLPLSQHSLCAMLRTWNM